MPAELSRQLKEMENWGRENDAHEMERSQKMLNLEPDTAQLLSILVQNGRCQRLLEVGTSNGYSTLWLAWAAQQVGGHVWSIDQNEAKHALAIANLERAGLRENVTLRQGDAGAVIEELAGPFDFVFLDANRFQYPALLPLFLPRLAPKALVLADNVHSHPDEIAAYLELMESRPEFEHVVVGVGKGLSVGLRRV